MKEAWQVFWEYMATSNNPDLEIEDALEAVHEWEHRRPGNHERLLFVALCIGSGVFVSAALCLGALMAALFGVYR